MKLPGLLLTLLLLQVSASGFTQNISYAAKNASLSTVFAEIKKQTGYVTFGAKELLKNGKPVTVSVTNMPVTDFLNLVLKDQPLQYRISEKTIFLSPKPNQPATEQDVTATPIKGRITDAAGNPLAGATVSGSKGAASTNAEGYFTMEANAGELLTITYIGYATRQLRVAANGPMLIALEQSASSLDTAAIVINTGFQLVKKEKMTGSTVTINSTELGKRYTPNILNNLEGRVPGLVNYRNTTTIRGVSTINASKSPLIVLDGLPIEGNISDVNPYDVDNITVLKDAAATAIYGARATNGVIVITTKKAKSKGIAVEFASDVTITEKPNIDFNLLSPAQQIDLENEVYQYVFANTGGLYPNTAAAVTATTTSISNGNAMQPVYYLNYQLARGVITQAQFDEEIAKLKQNNFRQQFKDNALLNGLLQQYNLAVRSEGERSNSSLVLNYKNDNTGIIKAYNKQFNIFYKGSFYPAKWFEANYGVNTVLGYQQGSNSNFATLGTNIPPYQQLLNENGERVYYTTADYNSYNTNAATQPINNLQVNHLEELEKDYKKTRLQNTRYFLNMRFKVLQGLTLEPQFQYENSVSNTEAYSESDSYVMRYLRSIYTTLLPASGGKLATTNTRGDYWTARGQATYQRTFGAHAIDVIAGTEFRQTVTKGNNNLLLGYDDQLQSQSTTTVSLPALNNFKTTTTFKPGFSTANVFTTYFNNAIGLIPETKHRFNSLYGNATYTYNNKYNVFGSYRIDYADVFGLDEKFRGKPLWSAGIGWNAHNEAFLSGINWINFLKARATYGITGNIVQGVSSFLTANSSFINTVTNLPLSVVTNAANPALRWEKTATANLGVDFALFNQRLNGSFDWYQKKGTDLLVTQRLDPSEGFTSQIINNGRLVNNGVELNLQYDWFRPKTKGGLAWTSSFLISYNKNKITYIDETATTPVALAQGGYRVGNPVNSLYSFQYQGLNNNGQPQWLKADGTLTTIALTSNDLTAVVYSGSTDPRVNITLSNEWRYKGFSVYVLAVYYGGHYLRALVPEVVGGVAYGSMPAYLADSWTPGKTNTIVPGFGRYAPGTYPGTTGVPPSHLTYSDQFVRPGDFIKIRSATLAYRVPQQLLNYIHSRGITFRFQLNNPQAVWTKNNVGIDPETGAARVPSSYVFGISVNY